MCKAELNSGDQAPELLSLGQNSTSATFQCGVQSWIVRGGFIFYSQVKEATKHTVIFFPLQMVSPRQRWVFGGCRTTVSSSQHAPDFGGCFFQQELKQNLRLWEKGHVRVKLFQSYPGKTSWLPKEFALHGSNHLKEVLNREETSAQKPCCKWSPNWMSIISNDFD